MGDDCTENNFHTFFNWILFPRGFTFMHLADSQYVCSLEIEPTTFALLTQCSTTEPQEHYDVFMYFNELAVKIKSWMIDILYDKRDNVNYRIFNVF